MKKIILSLIIVTIAICISIICYIRLNFYKETNIKNTTENRYFNNSILYTEALGFVQKEAIKGFVESSILRDSFDKSNEFCTIQLPIKYRHLSSDDGIVLCFRKNSVIYVVFGSAESNPLLRYGILYSPDGYNPLREKEEEPVNNKKDTGVIVTNHGYSELIENSWYYIEY